MSVWLWMSLTAWPSVCSITTPSAASLPRTQGSASLPIRFRASRRNQILADFRKRVQLALTDEELFVLINPLLDQLDAEIFRLAHDYRGPSYHRGDHNRALAGPLGRLYGCRRLDTVEDLIGGLRRDLEDERIAQLIEGAQHWSQHRGDEELHRLAREEQILENETEALGEEEPDDELKRRMVANRLAQFARIDELKSETEIRVELATVGLLRKRISRLNEKEGIDPARFLPPAR